MIEGSYSKKRGYITPYLSIQQLLDCSVEDTNINNVCSGLEYHLSLKYIKNKGITLDSLYPYISPYNQCKHNNIINPIKITKTSYCSNFQNNKNLYCDFFKVYTNLSKFPTAVRIDGQVMQFYKSRIYDSEHCQNDNHRVVLVGYRNDELGEYFTIRNSFGSDWGESEYMRITRSDPNNSCFITNESWIVAFD